MHKILYLLFFAGFISVSGQESIDVNIDFTDEPVEFRPYWKSTGFTPASAMFHPAMKMSFDLMGTQKNRGIIYVRPHYLLNLVGTRGLGTENVEYNWSRLDSVLSILVQNGLKPFFEIMGYPSMEWESGDHRFDPRFQEQLISEKPYFNDFEDEKKLREWKEMVTALATHLISRFGPEEVRSWYFESWNEPNINFFWKQSEQAFLNYYDACQAGLKEADSLLIFGGPGTAGAPDNGFFKKFLAHCDTGTHYFTGNKDVSADFLSYHVKARVRYMIDQEQNIVNYIKENHPSLSDIPLVNNEADPIAGWSRKYFWRGGPWYASFVVQSIDHHNMFLIDSSEPEYKLLSNDNGFMGDWYRRTLFARFMENNDQQIPATNSFYLIKKPVYSVMGLLASMGNKRYKTKLNNTDRHYGIIPTRKDNGDIIIGIYNSPLIEISNKRPSGKEKEFIDELIYEHSGVSFNLNLKGTEPGDYKLIHYRFDSTHTNPYRVWRYSEKPALPTRYEYLQMAAIQEPQILGIPTDVSIQSENTSIEIEMPAPSVSFIFLVKKNDSLPLPPSKLKAAIYTGLNGEDMYLLRWEDIHNSNVLSYDVHYRENGTKSFTKINPSFLRDKAFVHIPANSKGGEYKVKVKDFWGRESAFSSILKVSPVQH